MRTRVRRFSVRHLPPKNTISWVARAVVWVTLVEEADPYRQCGDPVEAAVGAVVV